MKTLALSVALLTLVIAGCGGGDEKTEGAAARPAAARPAASTPLEIPLKTAHHSGVTGTATLVPDGSNLKVTLKLSKRVDGRLMAHIHTGPCSKEPTFNNPRIWAGLNEVVDGRSETTVYGIVTLKELESETSSINVHDPAHNQRPLVCADIPGPD
jgi:hypothetical protein